RHGDLPRAVEAPGAEGFESRGKAWDGVSAGRRRGWPSPSLRPTPARHIGGRQYECRRPAPCEHRPAGLRDRDELVLAFREIHPARRDAPLEEEIDPGFGVRAQRSEGSPPREALALEAFIFFPTQKFHRR